MVLKQCHAAVVRCHSLRELFASLLNKIPEKQNGKHRKKPVIFSPRRPSSCGTIALLWPIQWGTLSKTSRHTPTHICACVRICIHNHTLTRRSDMHTCSRARRHVETHTRTETHTHKGTYVHIGNTCICTCKARTHAHTRTHTPTHAHLRAQYVLCACAALYEFPFVMYYFLLALGRLSLYLPWGPVT